MVFIKYFPERFLQSKPISMNTEASIESVCINPLSPNIHKQILQTDLYIIYFLTELVGRN